MNRGKLRGLWALGTTLAVLASFGCGGRMPEDLGFRDGSFAPCPDSPNCVSSFATDEQHGIAALAISGDPEAAWAALEAELENRPRVKIESRSTGYLHAVFTSRLMRYRDDVEFRLDGEDGEIAVRSASRVGYGDMGANRSRIESIRARLVEQGVIRASAEPAG